ncbi:MAG: BamA/TamA family outer membrane protein, partial [Pontixanthobacter sp.]
MTLAFDNLDNRYRPTRGLNVSLTAEVAGLGGSVSYIRTRGKATRYWNVFNNFIFSLSGEGGVINGYGGDEVRLTDRFFLGEPQIRGFDIRGVGPRVLRQPIIDDGNGGPQIVTDRNRVSDDSIGGNAYYLGRAELEIPLGTGARELGLRPSIFMDVGALFNIKTPQLQNSPFPGGLAFQVRDANGNLLFISENGLSTTDTVDSNNQPLSPLNQTIAPFQEVFLGDSSSPRVTIGIGVNWNSPFGPFRIDFAHALRKQPGDDTKRFTFNVGTQF